MNVGRGGDTALGEAWLITKLQKLPPARYIPIRVTLQLISRQTLTPTQFLVITQNCLSASKDVLSQASVNTLQHQLIWQKNGVSCKIWRFQSQRRAPDPDDDIFWSWGVISSIFLAMALRTIGNVLMKMWHLSCLALTALRCWKYDIYSNLLTIQPTPKFA